MDSALLVAVKIVKRAGNFHSDYIVLGGFADQMFSAEPTWTMPDMTGRFTWMGIWLLGEFVSATFTNEAAV